MECNHDHVRCVSSDAGKLEQLITTVEGLIKIIDGMSKVEKSFEFRINALENLILRNR